MERKIICFGEVLWDLLPEGPRVGGAPLNVCYHLNQNHIKSDIISQVGNDARGKALIAELHHLHLDADYIQLSNNHPTSIVEVSLDNEGKASYTIVEDVAWDYINIDEEIVNAIKQSDAFVFGSLVSRNAVSFSTLKTYLSYASYPVLDINLRSPHYQKEVLLELLEHCQLLKINDEEIAVVAKWLNTHETNEKDVVKLIFSHFDNIQEIILTKGADGAIYYDGKDFVDVKPYRIVVKDTIGSGDSFLAAFLVKKFNGSSIIEALDYASLLSAYVATRAGACPPYTESDLIDFKNTITHS